MAVQPHSYDRALAAIGECAASEETELRPVLACWESILRAQMDAGSRFRPDMQELDEARCRKRNSEGLPFLGARSVRMEWGLFDELCARIKEILRHEGASIVEAAGPGSAKKGEDAWRELMVRGMIEDGALLESAADKAGMGRDFFSFIMCQSLVPFMERYAECLRPFIDDTAWRKERCPVCGGEPLMARLENDTGRKFLQCHLCRTDWAFPRVACPFCGASNQEKLRYFFDERDEVHRVDVCDECKAYLKVIDLRKTTADAIVVVENVRTLHLDLVSHREGFRREAAERWGI